MPICAIKWCRNKSVTQNLSRGGVSYHRFPRDPSVREKWIASTGRHPNWIPSKVATICSVHFEPHDFVVKTGERRYLHSLAVPSRDVHSLQDEEPQQVTTFLGSLGVNFSSSAGFIGISPLLHSSLTQDTQLSPVPAPSPVSANHDINPSESRNGAATIEIEIMPENRMNLRPRDIKTLLRPDVNMNSETNEDDASTMKSIRAKLREQDILIKKLKLRNYRLKKRLFSLKSMEPMENLKRYK